MPSPQELIEGSARLWKRFYNRGTAIIETRGPTEFIGKIVDCPDLPVNHEVLFIPYWEEVLKLSGARRVTIVHTQCVATGAECCMSEYRWS
jgi:hypothetical protein